MRTATILAAGLLAAGCSRADDAGNSAAVARPASTADGVDQGYVDRMLRASAFDFSGCRQQPGMRGVTGVDDAGGEVIVALDSSGSMAARAGGGTRMDEARSAVASFLAALPATTRGGLAVFGDTGDNSAANKARSCQAPVHFLYPPGAIDAGRLNAAAATLRPAGWTPLAAAIRTAAGSFTVPGTQRRTLFVVSDGVETCGGDPVAAARGANRQAQVVVNVIGYGIVDPKEAATLRGVAAAGGGSYRGVSPGDLLTALRMQANRANDANAIAVTRAETGMQQCFLAGIARERDTLMSRVAADLAAGRITAGTNLAVARASSDRFERNYGEFVRIHEGNLSREQAARSANGDAVDAAATNATASPR